MTIMPEGPEVYTTSIQLHERLVGQTLLEVRILGKQERGDSGMDTIDTPATIHCVTSHGKKLLFYLNYNGSYRIIMSSLGMTGHWGYEKRNHCIYQLVFDGGLNLYYDTPRPFGSNVYITDREEELKRYKNIGPCLVRNREQITPDLWRAKLRSIKRSMEIRKVLLEQKYFSGVGNYVKSEALYLSKIRPDRKLESLRDDELENLRICVLWVIDTSIKSKGLTISDYETPNGDKGVYDTFVYGKDKDRLGNAVIKSTYSDARTSHWVAEYQS